ncbi:MAG: hypothetical protein ACK559_41385, partial [bacterium]
ARTAWEESERAADGGVQRPAPAWGSLAVLSADGAGRCDAVSAVRGRIQRDVDGSGAGELRADRQRQRGAT